MAQLVALVVTHDEDFRGEIGRLLRTGGVPVGLLEGRSAGEPSSPDLVVVDIRDDAASGMAAIERLRAGHVAAAIFAVRPATDPELILQAMRAGANEFFMWPVPRTISRAPCAAPPRGATRPTHRPSRRPRRWCSSAPRAAQARRRSPSTAPWSSRG